jgi:O-antigen biosynthesis protein
MRLATGKYVVLLNSDVLVLPGWLAMLLHTMKTWPRAGMVGSQMLDAAGVIMEAGGHVYRNGQPLNVGRGFRPEDMPLQSARVVDYISAACLLVRRELFLSLGLFNESFAPAYYEDTDAAFAHRRAGWDTVIQPLSSVLHYEGRSYGTGNNSEKQRLMDSNANKFHLAHKSLFQSLSPAPNETLAVVSPRRSVHSGILFYRQPHRILVLEDVVPEPDRDAGSIRLLALLQILKELGFSVFFESQPIANRNVGYLLQLFSDGIHAMAPGSLRAMAAASDSNFHDTLRANGVSLCPWDLLWVARRDVFDRHMRDFQYLCPGVPIVFDTVDVHFIREFRMFNMSDSTTKAPTAVHHSSKKVKIHIPTRQEELQKLEESKQRELSFMKMSNVTIVVSSDEQRTLQQMLGASADVRVVSNIYSTDESGETSDLQQQQREGAIFVGNMCHTPNVDAVDFIVKEVLKDEGALPTGFRMHFVWSRSKMCPNQVMERARRHPLTVIHMDVSNDELLALHRKVKVVLAPLRFGAGVKGKVNYALLHGVPVIATRMASEGMGLQHEQSFLLAESGEEFVQSIGRLYGDGALFEKLARGGLKVMSELFGRDVAKEKVRVMLSDLKLLPLKGEGMCPFNSYFDAHESYFGSFWRTQRFLIRSSKTTPKFREALFPLYPRSRFTAEYLAYCK